jgi:Ca2+:H+ antiporter
MSSAPSPTENTGLLSAGRRDRRSDYIREHGPWFGLLSAYHAIKATLCSSYANFLLVYVPLGIIAGARNWNPAAVLSSTFWPSSRSRR